MSPIKVSVIIPFYNAENFLKGCIECLVNQTLKEIEIILINDGSSDRGPDIVEEYTRHFKNVFLTNKKNSGQGESRNVGLEIARGEFVYFLDVDDFIAKDALEKAFNDAVRFNVDIVFFDSINVKEGSKNCDSISDLSNEQILLGSYMKRSVLPHRVLNGQQFVIDTLNSEEGFFVAVWLGLYRKSLIQKNGIAFVSSSYEDNIFSMEIALNAKAIIYRHEILHFRRLVPTSFIHEKKVEKHVVGALCVMDHATRLLDIKGLTVQAKRALKIWDLISAGNALANIRATSEDVRKRYKWQYVFYLLKTLRIYKLKLLLVSFLKL